MSREIKLTKGKVATGYAITKKIEQYDREAKEREKKELAAGMAAFALKTLTEINERYIKINGMKK